ncbi:hypothetical protein BU23DRAFT_565035 [Bimuria novae-zelandiae CBS 107.79]|uniref:Uncharacterized protein n=1 Tax=Bimuria novae-zelandiae CBS 107.79 TaxID=1447943 RepID=A0A6A5VJW9_9PLEO|nr:hypothetical protein BU23DRAFT_565035 [Bimuria novae-zelandiae CBS 107.79]
MPPESSNWRVKRKNVHNNALPRQAMIDPRHKAFNRVIRLEGQISTIIRIQHLLWRYHVCHNTPNFDLKLSEEPTPEEDAIMAHFLSRNGNMLDRAMGENMEAILESHKKHFVRFITGQMLQAGRMVYFDMIDELIFDFLDKGIDLAYEGHRLGSFARLIERNHLKHLPKEEREKDGLWAKIWWFQRLQNILQDESTDAM